MTNILRTGSVPSGAQAAGAACAEATRLLKKGQTAQAEEAFLRALSHDSDSFPAHSALGVLKHQLGDHAAALQHLQRALEIEPRSKEIALLLAQLLREANRPGDALVALTPVAAANTIDPVVGYQLARLQRETGDMDGARRCLEALVEHVTDHPGLFEELAVVNRECGDVDAAISCYERVAALRPDDPRAASATLFHRLYLRHDRRTLREQHVRWGERFAPRSMARYDHTNEPDPERCLRIGYVSADFGRTSAVPFIEPLLAYNDRARCMVTCYQVSGHDDEVTHRLRAMASEWRDADRLDDEALVALVRQDRIDILVDLNGHTRGGRLTAFARRPAPVQATYLGYGATSGVAAIDYRITDSFIDPAGEAERWYTEKLTRLPGSMWCFSPPRSAPAVRGAPASAAGVLTFGSFNNFPKLGADVIETWAAIGARLPGSRFVLVGVPGGLTRQRICDQFEHGGVSADRLTLHGRVGPEEYYSLFHRVDVALDSFPYNGGATTCDALWMGVPVVTLAGRGTLERSGLSLLGAVGMSDWVTESKEDYVARACEAAQQPGALEAIRTSLRSRIAGSRLCDGPRFATDMEVALRGMWRDWCASRVSERHT